MDKTGPALKKAFFEKGKGKGKAKEEACYQKVASVLMSLP